MLSTADFPDDMNTLKALLVVAGARDQRKQERIDRLELLVAAFRQAIFGRKSEKIAPDQFALALEDIETAIAAIHVEDEAVDPPKPRPAKPRNGNRGSLPKHLPRIEEVIEPEASVCGCGGDLHQIGEAEEDQETVRGTVSPTMIRAPRRDPGPVPRDRHPPPEVCLPVVFERGGASASPGAADSRRHADRGDGGACSGLQICRPPAALSPSADLQPPRHRSGPLNLSCLGWQGGL